MLRNTYLVVAILAVIAALLIGLNIGKKIAVTPQVPSPSPAGQSPPGGAPAPRLESYKNDQCGVRLMYPNSYSLLDSASGSALFRSTENPAQSFVITCQDDIPRPPLPNDKIETRMLQTTEGASISAKLYHDASPKDGTPIDALIFAHPIRKFDVFIAGFGSQFTAMLETLVIY